MALRKPAPDKSVGCEFCKHKQGDFYKDEEDSDITRVYCKARFDAVNAELMSKYCDFFERDPLFKRPKQQKSEGI